MQLMLSPGQGRRQQLQYRLGNTLSHRLIFHRIEQDHKLVPTDTGTAVGGAKAVFQPQAQGRQQGIAGVVTMGVVQRLETVQIDKQQSKTLLLSPGPVNAAHQLLIQQAAIGQAGQGVVQRQILNLFLLLLALQDQRRQM